MCTMETTRQPLRKVQKSAKYSASFTIYNKTIKLNGVKMKNVVYFLSRELKLAKQ